MKLQESNCSNCLANLIDNKKQTFIYRNWEGLKYDACITPLCDECIQTLEIIEENGRERFFLPAGRRPKEEDCYSRYGWFN